MKHVRLVILASAALSFLGGTARAQSLSAELKAEGAAALSKAARERGSAVRGAILFPQQKVGCAKCHAPGGQDLLGPDLTKLGDEATDAYLVEAMLVPSQLIKKGFETVTVTTTGGKVYSGRIVEQVSGKLVLRESSPNSPRIVLERSDVDEMTVNKKSAMPDNLVDQLANRQEFLDLLRYMIEIKAAGLSPGTTRLQTTSAGSGLGEELRGLVLLDDFQCRACHRGDLAGSLVPPKQAPNLAWAGGRINPNYIERFIADPLQVKPGTTMPDVMGTLDAKARRAAAREITHYLVSLSEATFQTQPLDSTVAARGGELFHSVGCVACHSPRDKGHSSRDKDSDERMADDAVPLVMLQQKYNRDGLVAFLENPHAVRPSGRMPNMQLSHWEAIEIAHYLLDGSSAGGQPVKRLQLDPALAARGKQRFGQLGCIQCHAKDEPISKADYPSLADAQTDRGCLSDEAGNWPRYDLNESQRGAMRAAIQHAPHNLTDQQQIALTLTSFKCVACHQRGDLGGVSPERNEYFHTTNPNLGPQGRIPPRLTRVGAKLQPKWMRQVLVSGRTIRPYMKTRMPQYGADNVGHLVDLFRRVDQLPEVAFAEFTDLKQMRNTGHEMAGTGGLNCIACHTFQLKRAATMPAVDLTEMAERLHKNWFYHYMLDPQRLSTNTVMPSFWPGGRAIRRDVLDGNTNQQIEALWQYLLDGRQARTPRGLIREPIELLATDEAVMLRRSYQGIGKRGIGVGYPNQVNLAFDAEQMRLAMIWKGKFADPAGVWRSQGHGTVRPLGSDLIRFAAGPELDDAGNPWTVDDGRPPKHQFQGYTLDELQRPTFMYRFDGIEVADYPIDVKDKDSGNALIRRTLTFTSERARPDVVFRAATNEQVVPGDSDSFLIGKTLRIRLDDEHDGRIVTTSAGKQLRIPLDIVQGKARLVLEYVWTSK